MKAVMRGKPRILNFLVHPNFFSCSRTVLGEGEVFLEFFSFSRTVLGIFFFQISPKISEECTRNAEGPRKFKWKETKNNAKEAHLLNV